MMKKAAALPNQTKVTDYYKIVSELDAAVFQLRQQNSSLLSSHDAMKKRLDKLESSSFHSLGAVTSNQSLLQRMMDQAISQVGKQSRGMRYNDPVLEHFSLNVWILGGRRLYEIFYSNFKGVFPSPTTIQEKLNRFHIPLEEGVCNVHLVKEYLVNNGAPLVVGLSEDATGVVGRREYRAKTNSVIGFVTPVKSNGFPDPTLSIVRDALDIVRLFRLYERARLAILKIKIN